MAQTSPVTAARLRVEIRGAVQGVGFRPFVYRLAAERALAGWVLNDPRGVILEAEGPREAVEEFLARLRDSAPPHARVDSLESSWLDPTGEAGFEIRRSEEAGERTALVLPDLATCPECLAEVLDPDDRRAGYPFANCTHCGPRFSIVEALPYDRPNTTMRAFALCPDCHAEYEDPRDRRFHAQPNACPRCGPRLALRTGDGATIAGGAAALDEALEGLRSGRVVAVKGLGGFLLMCDARDTAALRRLRERKPRREKPFALLVRDLAMARALCEVTPLAAAHLESAEAPILLLPRRRRTSQPGTEPEVALSDLVAPGNPRLGVMLPSTPLHHLLARGFGAPLVATSGNRTDEPICTDEDEALARLGRVADLFLVHDRPIARHVDDSVAWEFGGTLRLLRRARGFAPLPIALPAPVPPILAVGAHLKSAIALAVGRQAFVSQHIGDLETPEAIEAFERVIADFRRLYGVRPAAIAHDLHPDYRSTRWAVEQAAREGIPLIPVQHHHAHLASCLAEHGVEGPALGITWDGTGYGTDGRIWGGEFLLGDASGFERVAHLKPFRLPGGEAAIHDPRRVALALLVEALGPEVLADESLAVVRSFRRAERDLIARMLEHGIHAPVTTSMGRLFDGVSALLGVCSRASFEGQAAMALEFAADGDHGGYAISVLRPRTRLGKDGTPRPPGPLVLDWTPMLFELVRDLRVGVPVGILAARFHESLVLAAADVVMALDAPRVVLSGGCFQNRRLLSGVAATLERLERTVLVPAQVPPNDGGIALGQVAVAAATLAGTDRART